MGFLGDAHGCGGCKKVSHISYNDKTWRSYILPKEDPKKYCFKKHAYNFDDVSKSGYPRSS